MAAGVRRIEAITGIAAENYINEQSKLIQQLKELLKNPKDIGKSIEALLDENNRLKKEIEKSILEKSAGLKNELAEKAQNINGINFIAEKVSLPNADAVKNLAYQIKDIVPDLFLVLGTDIDAKPGLTVMISENLVKDKGLNAGQYCSRIGQGNTRRRWWSAIFCYCRRQGYNRVGGRYRKSEELSLKSVNSVQSLPYVPIRQAF